VETETLQLTATIKPDDTTDRTVSWSTSQEAVATVDANGLVTAIQAGKAVITAKTVTGVQAYCNVTVVAKTVAVSGLSLNHVKAEIIESNVLQLIATVSPEDATDKSVVWISSDETIGTVSPDGLFTAIKPGKVIVTATASNGLTATCEITVIEKPSGVEGIESDSAQVRVENDNIFAPDGSEVFDLNGRRVKPVALRAGIYIVKLPTGKAMKVLVD
ncbi:MAG: Ig-like domain-containing protein, partial [Paramuribaculum sp.]|nr:Ig-like domain-containing protein [Paramuribaculum sp.]